MMSRAVASVVVAAPANVEREGQVPLGLAAAGLEPELAGLAEEEVDRLLVVRCDGWSLRKKLRP